eukprot:scaffold2553_cov32-Attheya_sp.AAC.2
MSNSPKCAIFIHVTAYPSRWTKQMEKLVKGLMSTEMFYVQFVPAHSPKEGPKFPKSTLLAKCVEAQKIFSKCVDISTKQKPPPHDYDRARGEGAVAGPPPPPSYHNSSWKLISQGAEARLWQVPEFVSWCGTNPRSSN